MSEKYLQIGVPMNELPRPVGSANYKRVESSLSNPLANAIKFHDCFHNASMTNLRDLKDPVSQYFVFYVLRPQIVDIHNIFLSAHLM